MQAREAFGAGRYQDALDLFAKLYGETLHPNYLRNIGRCQQNLGDPDKAITSFREYLRQAKNVSQAERAEVEGFITELEEAKRQKTGAPAAAPAPTAPTPPPSALPVPKVSSPEPTNGTPRVIFVDPPRAEPAVYQTWWFWTTVGVVVAGGIVGALVLSGGGKPKCPTVCE